ncbi:putative toxin-antitoxin system toxin component, PIN family [Candidatus Amesbacteria bacterium]|nr:putative toxin-antitoxin system toxin component, PIN family [Candidatus Amesbacteria bacterium]
MKVVCDTNVLISAFKFGGVPYEIIKKAILEQIELISSPQILLETATTLKEKFGWENSEINSTIRFLGRVSKVIKPQVRINKAADPDDNKILECAVESGADYIITGDKKHLLPLKRFKGIPILSPRDFLSQVLYKLP